MLYVCDSKTNFIWLRRRLPALVPPQLGSDLYLSTRNWSSSPTFILVKNLVYVIGELANSLLTLAPLIQEVNLVYWASAWADP